jgi:hypothetical protein
MNDPFRRTPARSRRGIGGLLFAAAILPFACALSADSIAAAQSAATPVAQAADNLQAEYRLQQWHRVAKKDDRDSLIAAVLLGMPNEKDTSPLEGHAQVEQRLADHFGDDPLALFALALACQIQTEPCTQSQYYDGLVRTAPDNAVHWLMLPNGAAPNDVQLHAAAAASLADTHLGATIGILRKALNEQPAPRDVPNVDTRELMLLLRRHAVDLVPLPKFGAAVSLCKAPAAALREDCVALGRHLFADRSGTILTRMVGSAMLRRLLKGTPEEVAAKELRRDYVWLSEQIEGNPNADRERLQQQTVEFGEWEACQRAVERLGKPRQPPANWKPKDPQMLLLSEERTPAATK